MLKYDISILCDFYYFCTDILRIVGNELLALIGGLAYHNKKDVCYTFSSDLSKRRKFQ